MISVESALKLIDKETPTLKSERVDIAGTLGRVLAQDIVADSDVPPFDRSQMDGYAVKATNTAKTPVRLKIVGESAAGKSWRGELKSGEAVRIMTGAAMPAGADSVQKIELTRESNGFVEILEPTKRSRYVVPRGKETRRGAKVFSAGERVSGNMVASLAAFGYQSVRVSKAPRVAILATGSELVEIGKKPGRDQIRNSNSAMLKAMLQDLTIEARVLPIAKDDIRSLKTAIRSAAADSDIVIVTGGVSVGKYDLTKPAIEALGANVFFERVELKPGKPTVFAKRGKTLYFGLPGNPVSVAVTFFLFVRRAIMLMQSAASVVAPGGFAVLDSKAKGTRERDTYLPVTLASSHDGRLFAVPLEWHGSSDFTGFARCDALVIVPKGENFEAGDVAEVLFL